MRQPTDGADSAGTGSPLVRPPDPYRSLLTPQRARDISSNNPSPTALRALSITERIDISTLSVPTTPTRVIDPERVSPVALTTLAPTVADRALGAVQSGEENDVTRREHLRAVHTAAAEVTRATANLVAACSSRAGLHRYSADKVLGYMAEDIRSYPVMALHVAQQLAAIPAAGGHDHVHPAFCVATEARNALAGSLWGQIKALVSL